MKKSKFSRFLAVLFTTVLCVTQINTGVKVNASDPETAILKRVYIDDPENDNPNFTMAVTPDEIAAATVAELILVGYYIDGSAAGSDRAVYSLDLSALESPISSYARLLVNNTDVTCTGDLPISYEAVFLANSSINSAMVLATCTDVKCDAGATAKDVFDFFLSYMVPEVTEGDPEPEPAISWWTMFTVNSTSTLEDNVDVDDVEIADNAVLTIAGENGYLAANHSFVLGTGASIYTEKDYPVIEIREGVEPVTGFTRYVWDEEREEYVEYTGTGEAYVYEYLIIGGTDEAPVKGWVRRDIMGPGPLDWFDLEGTAYNKEIQFDLNIPDGYGSIAVSKINGAAYDASYAGESSNESVRTSANTAIFSDERCNLTRIRMANGAGGNATIEFTLNFVNPTQRFEFMMPGYYSEMPGEDPDFHVDRWQLEDPNQEYDLTGTPIVSYVPAQNGLSATLTIELTTEYTEVFFTLCGGMEPGVDIRFDDNITGLQTTVDGWLATAVSGLQAKEYAYSYDFAEAGPYSISFAGLASFSNYKGFMYLEYTSEWGRPDKWHISNASSLTLDPAHYYEIELIVREEEAPLYDNQYCASISDHGDRFTINGTAVSHGDIVAYTGSEITLSYTLPEGLTEAPYVVMRYDRSPVEEVIEFTGNTATVTTDGYPVYFNIYWSEDEYNFNRIDFDRSSEICLEYFVGENGSMTLTRSGLALVPVKSVAYNGWTRAVISNSAAGTLHFEITADQGYKIDAGNFRMRVYTAGGDTEFDVATDTSIIANLNIAQDMTSASGDWNITNLNGLNVMFEPAGNSEPGGNNDPGNNNPGTNFTPENCVDALENHLIAYAATTAKTVTQLAADELWNVFFGTIYGGGGEVRHVGDYAAFFENRAAFDAALTFGSPTSDDSHVYMPNAAEPLQYCTFSLQIPADGTPGCTETLNAAGRIYILESENNMIVRTITGGTPQYQVITVTPYDEDHPENGGFDAWHPYILDCTYDTNADEIAEVEVFGNGATFVNVTDSGNRGQCFGGHITGERTGYCDSKLSFKLEIYNTTFEGVHISGNGGNKEDGGQGLASAWSWFEMSSIPTNGTTSAKPVEYNIFSGNTRIYLDSETDRGSKKKITSVTCSLATAARAVKITQSGDNFVVEPLSNFYTDLPLVITYEGGDIGYLLIHIVAMDIQDNAVGGNSTNNDINIWHGTDNNTVFDCPERNAITATFYYTWDVDPENSSGQVDESKRVILEATYTWNDGTVTRKTITTPVNNTLITDLGKHDPSRNYEMTNADDFILWQGAETDKPVKIEVIAIRSGTGTNDFAGALFGGGAGITWSKD